MLPTRERSSSTPLPLERTQARPASAPTPSTAVRTTSSSSASRSRFDATASPSRRIESCTRPRCWLTSTEPALELPRHLVELLAERRELVTADGRDLGREVTGGELSRGSQEAVDLTLQGARDEHRADDREQQEAGEDRAGERPVGSWPTSVVSVRANVTMRIFWPVNERPCRRICRTRYSSPPSVDGVARWTPRSPGRSPSGCVLASTRLPLTTIVCSSARSRAWRT